MRAKCLFPRRLSRIDGITDTRTTGQNTGALGLGTISMYGSQNLPSGLTFLFYWFALTGCCWSSMVTAFEGFLGFFFKISFFVNLCLNDEFGNRSKITI